MINLNTEIFPVRRIVDPAESLYQSLTDGKFSVYYQPIFDIQSIPVQLFGVESLIRIIENDRLVTAETFIDEINKFPDFRVCLSRFVVSRVIADSASIPPPIEIRINISPSDLAIDSFVDWMINAINDSSTDNNRFCIELVETQSNADYSEALFKLRKHKLKIALDDWGIEESNLSRLLYYPDEMKIDKFFAPNPGNPEAIKGCLISYFAASLFGAKTTLEGIENKSQLEIARSIGIDYGQGFLWSRAIPIDRLIHDWL